MKTVWMLLLAAVIASCKKNLDVPADIPKPPSETEGNFFIQNRRTPDFPVNGSSPAATAGMKGSAPLPAEFDDELPTILGVQLNNPYSISNMVQAYNVLYGSNLTTLPVTDLYVRFAPQTEAQFAYLEDSLDLDVYDHPLDYELIQDGDYYVDPGRSIEDLPYLYTVVEPDFQFPAGIPYTILSNLHIPPNDDLLLEEFAESIAEGAVYQRSGTKSDSVTITRTDIPGNYSMRLPAPCYSFIINEYDDFGNWWDQCGGSGTGGGGTGGGTGSGTVCGLPALQCSDSKRPKGRIRVWDTQLNGGVCVPVVNVKVVCKRWFKGIRRSRHLYTNAMGEFTATQKFNRKVKVKVHFRNANVSLRPMRTNLGIRLSLFTIKHRVGVFEGCAMNTIDQIYYRHTSRSSKSFMYWLAAHAINAREAQWAQASADGIKPFDGHRLVMYLMKGGTYYDRAPYADILMQSYLYKTRPAGEWILEIAKIAYYVAKKNYLAGGVQLIENVLGGQRPDILFSYNTDWNNLSSNEVNQKLYAAFAQCGLLKAVGAGGGVGERWKYHYKAKDKIMDIAVGIAGVGLQLAYKEVFEGPKVTLGPSIAMSVQSILLFLNIQLSQPTRQFYEQVEGFGDYYGHYMADKRYGTFADAIKNQRGEAIASGSGRSSHKNYLETWNPYEQMDEEINHRVGLFNDLEDNSASEIVPFTTIFDLTSGIKAKDYEKAFLGKSPGTVAEPELWRHSMLNLQPAFVSQQGAITSLFAAYNVN